MYACELGGSFAGGSPCLAYVYELYVYIVKQKEIIIKICKVPHYLRVHYCTTSL